MMETWGQIQNQPYMRRPYKKTSVFFLRRKVCGGRGVLSQNFPTAFWNLSEHAGPRKNEDCIFLLLRFIATLQGFTSVIQRHALQPYDLRSWTIW